jgi:hypothetical protein
MGSVGARVVFATLGFFASFSLYPQPDFPFSPPIPLNRIDRDVGITATTCHLQAFCAGVIYAVLPHNLDRLQHNRRDLNDHR